MSSIPISPDLVKQLAEKYNIAAPGKASIREIVSLVNLIEHQTGIKFVRMEMGVPGLYTPSVGIDAEIDALKRGVASVYPNINGLRTLKEETSRFIKLFLDVDINQEGCIPTVGSMMGSMAGFLVANSTDQTKKSTLFIDPGFPVHKQQARMLGQDYYSFDVFNHRGKKLKTRIESYLKTGKISSILYSNPNNPAWICFNEEELAIIGELSVKYDVIVVEDLAYFGMDFRKDYSMPGQPPFQPTVARYADNYIVLISSSKIFSYAGERIGMMAISNHLYERQYTDLKRFYSTGMFGHAVIFGALYNLSAGVTHSAQYGFAAMLKAANDGSLNFREDVMEYGEKAGIIKASFISNGFEIVYDKDIDEPIADGFYFTISYPGMTGSELLEKLLYYGISAISLEITGSDRQGLRVCVSMVSHDQFGDIELRLMKFSEDHPIK
jgi:aspartate/methionine/tyrosine aminotransferase